MLLTHKSVKEIWHTCKGIDVGTLFPADCLRWHKKIPKTHELKHSALQDHITSQVKSLAHEATLNTIMKDTYYEQKKE